MKNLFRLCLMLTVVSVLASCENIAHKQKETYSLHVDTARRTNPIGFVLDTKSVAIINAMAKEVQRVDSVQFGVCDTCTTGFKAAMIENRLLAERLARESHTLREQLQKMNETIMINDQLLDKSEGKRKELVTINVEMSDEMNAIMADRKIPKVQPFYVKK
jgi:hypothetical protein